MKNLLTLLMGIVVGFSGFVLINLISANLQASWATASSGSTVGVMPGENNEVVSRHDADSYFREVAVGSEFGGDGVTRRWRGDIKIKIHGMPTDSDRQTINGIIVELKALTGLNISVVTSGQNIDMHFVPEKNFQSIEPNYVIGNKGFFWVKWNSDNVINYARILIAIEGLTPRERHHLIREELTQSLGIMKDSGRHPSSIFYSGWTDTTEYSEIDKQIIRMLYL